MAKTISQEEARMINGVFTFADDADLDWAVVDYSGTPDTREPMSLGNPNADGRAFIPVDRDGPVLLYHLGRETYRDTERRTLLNQLHFAKPAPADRA
jgi:hypothetical protein